jgi:hypothetical protein
MPATKARNQGKTSFVKELLIDHQMANTKAVNEAWKAAGMEGTISETLVNKMRSVLGLTGNLRKRSQPVSGDAVAAATKTKKSAKPKPASPTPKTKPKGKAQAAVKFSAPAPAAVRTARAGDRDRLLAEAEGDIDRLIFKLMVVDGMERIEDELRRVRRQLVRSHKS